MLAIIDHQARIHTERGCQDRIVFGKIHRMITRELFNLAAAQAVDAAIADVKNMQGFGL